MMSLFNLHSISTLTQAAAISNIQPNKQQKLQQSEKNFKSQVIQMIKNVNSVQIRSENLHFFIGATSALAFVGKVFFKKGDTVSIDTPVYPGVHGDFQSRVSLKYVHEDIFKSTLLRRVTRAKQDGSKGYVILNANNPTGYVYSEKQIRQVCEWAANNQDFMIIFDEMYVNLIDGGIKTCSSAQYARNLPNIQTIRGFAKQFGLCGFKVPYLVTSNQEAIKSYLKLKDLLVPHPYSLWTVSNMMKRSSHGQQILSAGLSMAEQAIATTCAELDRYSIKYLKPKAGVFVFIDLRDYLKQNIHLNEYLLFKKIFFEYKINVACGSDYKTLEPGWFRICTVIDEQSIKEGIRRIGLLLKNQPLT